MESVHFTEEKIQVTTSKCYTVDGDHTDLDYSYHQIGNWVKSLGMVYSEP